MFAAPCLVLFTESDKTGVRRLQSTLMLILRVEAVPTLSLTEPSILRPDFSLCLTLKLGIDFRLIQLQVAQTPHLLALGASLDAKLLLRADNGEASGAIVHLHGVLLSLAD
jgi:hypothetical protein